MRRSDREVKEFKDIVAIMEKCDVCRIALNDNDYPYILPFNFGMCVKDEKIELYFHGAMEGTKYDALRILMKHYHREEFPLNQEVMPRTKVFKLVVEKVTGKIRVKK